MPGTVDIKKDFLKKRNQLFLDNEKNVESLEFSMVYSLLVEDQIRFLTKNRKLGLR